jgi:hypothetical protein
MEGGVADGSVVDVVVEIRPAIDVWLEPGPDQYTA